MNLKRTDVHRFFGEMGEEVLVCQCAFDPQG